MKGLKKAAALLTAYGKEFLSSSLSLIFPHLCLHCGDDLLISEHLFCSSCLQILTLIDPLERCPICFSSVDYPKNLPFCPCKRSDFVFNRFGAAFDYEGPAATLTRKLKYGGQASLAKGMAAFMYTQLDRLSWPFPDLIVPVPISSLHRLERGFNQSFLLAWELAQILNRPVVDCLKRKSGEFSQASLSKKQRILFSKNSVFVKEETYLQGKSVLIVDDVMTTGSTLRACAEAIADKLPSVIQGFVFCKR